MDALETELFEACKAIADDILFNYHEAGLIRLEEIWTDEDRANLCSEYYSIAVQYLKTARTYEKDPRVVIRAVNYLAGQAVPPSGNNSAWFRFGLHALILLASPVQSTGPKGKPFLADIRRGLKMAETEDFGMTSP